MRRVIDNILAIIFILIILNACEDSVGSSFEKPELVDYSGQYIEQAQENKELFDKVQKATFDYFWEFAHPVSGLTPRRSVDSESIGVGASGFGVSCVVVGVHRNWITRRKGINRLLKATDFLLNKATHFDGIFPHLLNGSTGELQKFGDQDGSDLQETSNLISGLLIARQFFNGSSEDEIELRNRITTIFERVQYNKHTDNDSGNLYWNWSPTKGYTLPLRGFTEGLVSYVLGYASPQYTLSPQTYNCWLEGRNFVNGNSYFGYTLALGKKYAGPLYLAQTSFIGLNPKQLEDQYANYWHRNVAHVMINRHYCVYEAPESYGYSEENWGLSASQTPNGYNNDASPLDDEGVICPSGALGVFPYTPYYSMQAMRYFYENHKAGLWSTYGFKDAFSIKDNWYSDRYLALDQGRTVVMMENYRSGLLWDLYMEIPEIKSALSTLGYREPQYKTGFHLAVADVKTGCYDLMVHPHLEKCALDFYLESNAKVTFIILDENQNLVEIIEDQVSYSSGAHVLEFVPKGIAPGETGYVVMETAGNSISLKVEFH